MRKKEMINSLELLKNHYTELSVRESERTTKLNKEIFELKKKIYQLENPFKFNLGDEVEILVKAFRIGYIEEDDLNNIFKIVDREYVKSMYENSYKSNKEYTLYDCKTNKKTKEYENNIKLYVKKGENKK